MANKVYDRYEHEGKEYLLLLKDETITELDASWIKNQKDLQNFKDMLHRFAEVGEYWFWIDTGVVVKLAKHDKGYAWLIDDTRENSQRYVWLTRKAKRFQSKIVERLNELSDLLSTGMDPDEVIENVKETVPEEEEQNAWEDSSREDSGDSSS